MQNLGDTILGAAARIGQNRARVVQGLDTLARAHLPFNRKEKVLTRSTIQSIVSHCKDQGLDRPRLDQLKTVLYSEPTKDLAPEEFHLSFKMDRAEAKEHILTNCGLLAWVVYEEIAAHCEPRSDSVHSLSRRRLAELNHCTPAAISQQITALERAGVLARVPGQDQRDRRYQGYRFVRWFPTWRGDRAARLDAKHRAADPRQLDIERHVAA